MKSNSVHYLTLLLIILFQIGTQTQNFASIISGKLIDENKAPICYATIGIFQQKDTTLIAGSITDDMGNFSLAINEPGNYLLTASFIGYQKKSQNIKIETGIELDMGTIILSEIAIELSEAEIIAERIKAKQQMGKTSYFVNSKMQKASHTVLDMIQYVPGIQVDLLQNITIEGSKDIIIEVDGIQREPGYLRMLNSEKIDKIEINNKPGPAYHSEVSGIMNIILKKKKINGISGHLFADIPTNKKEVFSFPSASLNLVINKLNVYTSYNGEFSSFDKKYDHLKQNLIHNSKSTIHKEELLLQKNWSHKFSFGLDYLIDSENQLNFYTYLNTYSYENDGIQIIEEKSNNQELNHWTLSRDDQNKNRSIFASIFYKHLFEKPGNSLTLDLNYYHLKAENAMILQSTSSNTSFINRLMPRKHIIVGRLKSNFQMSSQIKMESGLNLNLQNTKDADQSLYHYQRNNFAAYSSLVYSKQKIQINAGLRLEYSNFGLSDDLEIRNLNVLPDFKINFELAKNNNLKLSYLKSLKWPLSHQLNPKQNPVDPYTTFQGNPDLVPSASEEVSINFSTLINNNYISIETFYLRIENSIGNLTTLSNSGLFNIHTQNLGDLNMYGFKLLGSLIPLKNISFNPYLKLAKVRTKPNEKAIQEGIFKKQEYAFEAAMSLALLLKNDISISTTLQYNKSRVRIDRNDYEDLLYFISLDKTMSKKIKIGLTCAIPFKREFKSHAYESNNNIFTESMSERIQMSNFPIWLKIKYSFASGKKLNRSHRPIEIKEENRKKGF